MQASYMNKKPHRLPLTSMSSYYAEAHKAEFKEANDYAKGRATSMGVSALLKEKKGTKAKKLSGISSKAKMLFGQEIRRLFTHRKM